MSWDKVAGEAVRETRRMRGLTQGALATVAGVPQSTISELESGKRQPSLPLLARIIESAQGPSHLHITARERHSAAGTAERVTASLASGPAGEDSALRAVLDLRDVLGKANGKRLGALSGQAPLLCGNRRFDAFILSLIHI